MSAESLQRIEVAIPTNPMQQAIDVISTCFRGKNNVKDVRPRNNVVKINTLPYLHSQEDGFQILGPVSMTKEQSKVWLEQSWAVHAPAFLVYMRSLFWRSDLWNFREGSANMRGIDVWSDLTDEKIIDRYI